MTNRMTAMMKSAALALSLILPLANGAAPARAEGLVEFKVMDTDTALALAQAAMTHCRDAGYQVSVVVVDRFGLTQTALRDRFGGPHTIETATRKAWTAVSFRTDTLALSNLTKGDSEMSAIRDLSMALALGGGVPVEAAGSIVGGVGVSGAPAPSLDDECARAGIAAVQADLEF